MQQILHLKLEFCLCIKIRFATLNGGLYLNFENWKIKLKIRKGKKKGDHT
jgi:hypothetical protein